MGLNPCRQLRTHSKPERSTYTLALSKREKENKKIKNCTHLLACLRTQHSLSLVRIKGFYSIGLSQKKKCSLQW